jgi:DNA invertase Pin-like site-specific DNA recombinase
MTVIGYARVSSESQFLESNALEQQIQRLKDAGAKVIISDVASGSSDKREGFKKLISIIKKNEAVEIIVTRLDRLTRKLSTLLELRNLFLNSTVNLKALDDAIDLSTPAGKFHFSLLGSLAEMEVDRLSERIKHGQEYLRKNKKIPQCPFGYKHTADLKLELDTEPALCLLETKQVYSRYDLAKEIIDLVINKKSLRAAISNFHKKFGIIRYHKGKGRLPLGNIGWSHPGLKSWITSKVIQGHTFYKTNNTPEIYFDTHKAIISPELAREVQNIIAHNRETKGFGGTHRARFATSGLVKCGSCLNKHRLISGTYKGKTTYYYQCKGWYYGSCTQKKTIKQQEVENAIINSLVIKSQELTEKVISDIKKEIPSENSQVIALKEQLNILHSLPYNIAISQAIKDIELQIINLKKQQELHNDEVDLRDNMLKVFQHTDFWEQQTEEDRKRIFREFVNCVWIKDGKVVSVDLKI